METNAQKESMDICLMPEELIIEQARSGDAKALEFILNKYKSFVRAKARTYFLIGADKEDIIQEGMIGLYKAIRDFKSDKLSSFGAFAELCITRQIISAIKSATRQKHAPLNSYVSLNKPIFEGESDYTLMDIIGEEISNDPEQMVIDKEDCDVIEESITKTLSSFERKVLKLYMSGYSYVYISRKLSRDIKSIDNALQRIKRKLEEHRG